MIISSLFQTRSLWLRLTLFHWIDRLLAYQAMLRRPVLSKRLLDIAFMFHYYYGFMPCFDSCSPFQQLSTGMPWRRDPIMRDFSGRTFEVSMHACPGIPSQVHTVCKELPAADYPAANRPFTATMTPSVYLQLSADRLSEVLCHPFQRQ